MNQLWSELDNPSNMVDACKWLASEKVIEKISKGTKNFAPHIYHHDSFDCGKHAT